MSVDYAKLIPVAVAQANSAPNLEDNVYPMLRLLTLPGVGVVISKSGSGTLDGSLLSYFKVSIEPAKLVPYIDTSMLSEADKVRITSVLGWRTITCYLGFDSSGRLRQVNDLASTTIRGATMKLDMVENSIPWPHPNPVVAPPAHLVFDRTQVVNSGAARLNTGTIQAA